MAVVSLALASCTKESGDKASSTGGAPAKSAVISKGGNYSPKDYLSPGYVTILDFYADW
jgi:hypothetical protein